MKTHAASQLITEDDILMIPEAATLTKRSPGAVRNLVMRGRIPYRKVAGRLVFIRSELLKWIAGSPGIRLEEIGKIDR